MDGRGEVEAERHPETIVVTHVSHDGGLDENDSNEDGMRVDGFEIYFEDRATKLTDGFRK